MVSSAELRSLALGGIVVVGGLGLGKIVVDQIMAPRPKLSPKLSQRDLLGNDPVAWAAVLFFGGLALYEAPTVIRGWWEAAQ
jgi:hypothetical protein